MTPTLKALLDNYVELKFFEMMSNILKYSALGSLIIVTVLTVFPFAKMSIDELIAGTFEFDIQDIFEVLK